jgi:hypothetical protein
MCKIVRRIDLEGMEQKHLVKRSRIREESCGDCVLSTDVAPSCWFSTFTFTNIRAKSQHFLVLSQLERVEKLFRNTLARRYNACGEDAA